MAEILMKALKVMRHFKKNKHCYMQKVHILVNLLHVTAYESFISKALDKQQRCLMFDWQNW